MRMALTGGAAALLLAGAPLGAQTAAAIAARVASAPDGEVHLTYASRATACGDGGDVVAVGQALTVWSSMESYGRWSGVTCHHGPARVTLTVRDHQVVGIRSRVGGTWEAAEGRVTELGTVPAREAATYFMELASRIGASQRSNPLLAAALADSADVAPEMLALARDARQPRETRRRAVNFTGVLGSPAMARPLAELARGGGEEERMRRDDVGPGDGIAGAATGALAMLEDDAGVPALLDLARTASEPVRKAAVFWLGQRDDPRGRALVRSIIESDRESETLRGAAIFALGQGGNTNAADAEFLRGVFDRLPTERLKDRVLMAMSQGGGDADQRWLLARVRDDRQPVEVRRKAAFWAGQGHAPLGELVALYKDVREPRLREHLIFVLSQRGEGAATDALLEIARADEDRQMRRKALFWLAQKNDPRVAKLIADIVSR